MTFSLVGLVISAIVAILKAVGLPGLFAVMAVESFGIPPIPSEVILPFAGYLVAEGIFPLYGAFAVSVLGGLAGAFAAYAIGRWWRHRLLDLGVGPLRLKPSHLAAMDAFFARRGEATVALARLMPVVRSYISYPAGTARMAPARFALFTVAGLAPFALAFLYAGIVLRAHWGEVEAVFGWFNYVALAAVVALAVYLYLLLTERITGGWPPRRRAAGAGP